LRVAVRQGKKVVAGRRLVLRSSADSKLLSAGESSSAESSARSEQVHLRYAPVVQFVSSSQDAGLAFKFIHRKDVSYHFCI